jgi:ribosomal protein L5
VTGRYAKPLHQQAVHNKDANNEVAPVKVYQGQLIAVKLKLKERSVFRFMASALTTLITRKQYSNSGREENIRRIIFGMY